MNSLRLLLCLLTLAPLGFGASGLGDVLKAKKLLGPELWSTILRVEPAVGEAFTVLVFEFNRALWIYTPGVGTGNLSTHQGRAEADKAQLLDLALKRYPEARSLSYLPNPGSTKPSSGLPEKACFITSIAAWRSARVGLPNDSPASLFSYYWDRGSGLEGHTVLLLQLPCGYLVLDPSRPACSRLWIPKTAVRSEKQIAQRIDPNITVTQTRSLVIRANAG